MAGTTPKARGLGAELRTAREAANVGLREMARLLEVGHATVVRWEKGETSPSADDVIEYLTKVGATRELREKLVALAHDPDSAHWYAIGMPEVQQQLGALVEIEHDATAIFSWSPLLAPGMLQTGSYARAIMIGAEVPREEIDLKVAVRVGRREVITRRNPVGYTAVIYEPVLSQLIGGTDVMTDQRAAFLEHCARPNVTLRVLPTKSGWHPGLEGPFTRYTFDASRDPVVHIENRISGLFLHEPDEVEKYDAAVRGILELAMSPEESAELIACHQKEETTKRDDTR